MTPNVIGQENNTDSMDGLKRKISTVSTISFGSSNKKNENKDSISVESAQSEDPWGVVGFIEDDSPKWNELDRRGKAKRVTITTLKILGVLAALYFFIISISLMSSAFQCLAGETAGEIFSSPLLKNPITGVVIGMLVTVLVQSSSTSTSIVVAMVGSGILDVHEAIPIIMGSNIGTSVTNTIVAMTHVMETDQFRRAFAGATVHDMFNLLNVLVLLPIEVITGYLEKTSGAIMGSGTDVSIAEGPEMLDVITDPLTDKIIKINKTVIKLVAQDVQLEKGASMINVWCSREKVTLNSSIAGNGTGCNFTASPECTVYVGREKCTTQDFLFANTGMSDPAAGAILLVVSLIGLSACLVILVKLLNSMLKGTTAMIIKKVINNNLPYPFGWLTGYLAILVGAGLTFIVQSSSVFTSSITPLCGIGVISLKRMYPLTLGSNIGTCTTSLLAALATSSSGIKNALQISLCHLFFNLTGIIIWYPIPQLRHVPIRGAKFLGKRTASYKWFAVLYLVAVFFLIPLLLLGLSFAGIWVLGGFLIVIGLVILFVGVVKIMQRKCPQVLPLVLRDWKFLPIWIRSLQPYDHFLVSYICCCKTFQTNRVEIEQDVVKKEYDNMAYEHETKLTKL